MAILTVQQGTSAAGLNPTLVAADAALTDSFVNDGQTIFVVENSNAATRTLTATVQVPSVSKDGFGTVATANQVATIAATTGRTIMGPFPSSFNDINGRVTIGYSAQAGLTVAAVRVPRQL